MNNLFLPYAREILHNFSNKTILWLHAHFTTKKKRALAPHTFLPSRDAHCSPEREPSQIKPLATSPTPPQRNLI